MSAPQDSWALPLANELVNAFRETEVVFVMRGGTAYNPETGEVVTEEVRYPCGAAVLKTARVEGGGTAEEWTCEMWFDSTTLPVLPTTADTVLYLDRTWRIVAVEPHYGSGPTNYAYKLRLRT
jgi:hypothetical protein